MSKIEKTNFDLEISKIPKGFRRTFEIIPGFVSWSFLLLFIILSFIQPVAAAFILIAFDLFWLIKSLSIAGRLIQGYVRLHQTDNVDWATRLSDLHNIDSAIDRLSKTSTKSNGYSLYFENKRYIRFLNLIRLKKHIKNPDQIYNAVIIATYNESNDILEPTVKSLVSSAYDQKNKMIVLIAYEERGGLQIEQTVNKIINKYSRDFLIIKSIKHKHDVKGEVMGKGPNITNAGRLLEKMVLDMGIPIDDVVVTTLDSDNRPSEQYFNYLTFLYATSDNRLAQSYKPVAMLYNNIWDAPAAMRVVAAGNSFWNVSLSMRPHLIRNFSAHAQGLAALIKTDFWSVETIVEDGHQFWRSYFTFGNDYEVVPMYTPIYQDAVLAGTYLRTILVQFKQIRRWAWGASDIAYVAYYGLKDKTIRKSDKLSKFFRLFESHFSWATAPLILAFMAWAPLFLNPGSNKSIVVHQLPIVVSRIQTVTMVGLFITVIISLLSLPPRPKEYRKSKSLLMIFQWILFPVTTIVFGSIAALNAQTRLMLGKYLEEFEVTEKAVKHAD